MRRIGSRWRLTIRRGDKTYDVEAATVFVAGGAIQTPALLQRSGVRQNVGRSLDLHPTVKIVAEFDEPINNGDAVVGVHQVKEFSPRIGLGCSISTPPYLGIAMLDHRDAAARLRERASRQAIYYAMVAGAGSGAVRALPGFRDPLVRYKLHDRGLRDLADGLRIVAQCAFAAGAKIVYPSVGGMAPLTDVDQLSTVPAVLPPARTSLMTVHLFSSCPMGEDRSRCAVDSFGKVHEADGLYVSDASLLCSAPGVNPQGSIMGFARRNALKFLNRL
jgi:choline dehydrogenase-like flavoprotein